MLEQLKEECSGDLRTQTEDNIVAARNASAELTKLCAELFQTTPITWMSYSFLTRHREFVTISTQHEVTEFYLNDHCYQAEYGDVHYDDLNSGNFFTNANEPVERDLRRELMTKFGLADFLKVVDKNYNYCDIFQFAAQVGQKQMANFYLNNIAFLHQFISSIKEPLGNIMHTHHLPRVVIPSYEATSNMQYEPAATASVVTQPVLTELGLNSGGMAESVNHNLSMLSERELECFKYIIRGLTSKEIAKEISISHRTVENYCERIKAKLNCRSKHEILIKYANVV